MQEKPFCKILFLCTIVMLLLFHCDEVYSQREEVTIYERKKAELMMQIWPKFGQDAARFAFSVINNSSDENVFNSAKGIAVAAALVGSSSEYRAVIWYAEELKKIQKLKTDVDFQKERMDESRREHEAYEKTDKGSIKKNIKTDFEQWNTKKEFEKHADYVKRLEDKSQEVFSEICANKIKKSINSYKNNELKITLLTYDSKEEFFPIVFKFNGIELESRLSIPIENAEKFKNNWSSEYKINNYDWCFVEHNLYPTIVVVHTKDDKLKYEFQLSPKNQSDISCSFDELNIENPYLKGYTFRYSNEKSINQQRFVNYCNSLDSVLNDYNHKLLQNPYNVSGKIIENYKDIENDEKIEYYYSQSVAKMHSEFEILSNTFERELKYQNPSEYSKIYYSLNPEQLEIEKREILNFIDVNSKFVKSMDFRKEKKESLGSVLGLGLLDVATGINLRKEDYTKENERRKKILSVIDSSVDKPYYPQVIDVVIETNKGLKKEWIMNKQSFDNKTEFYKAYISGNNISKRITTVYGAGQADGRSQGDAASGKGNQGSPFGNSDHGENEGIGGYGSFNLYGRSIGTEGIPRPAYTTLEEGRIVVNITVDPKGNVIAANIGRGTNIDNPSMRKSALEAAQRTKFNNANMVNNQSGTITYRYSLK